jgi:hypothetical protein
MKTWSEFATGPVLTDEEKLILACLFRLQRMEGLIRSSWTRPIQAIYEEAVKAAEEASSIETAGTTTV